MDEISNTDWCCTKFDIRVQCLISADYIDYLFTDLTNKNQITNAADAMKVVRTRLLQPRKALSYKVNGQELLPTQQQGFSSQEQTVDARNGPVPQSCIVQQVTNETFLVLYHITANYWEKYTNQQDSNNLLINRNLNSSQVLTNRWTETVEMDDCMYTRRTREGRYMIRSDNIQGQIADYYRSSFAVVSVPDGFLRESAKYVQSPDGLSLQYTIVDKEKFKFPPQPAFEARGTYTETTTSRGAIRYGTVDLTLKGAKTTNQVDMIKVALSLANQKLRLNGAQQLGGGLAFTGAFAGQFGLALLERAYVTVDMYENIVRLNVKAMLNGPRVTPFGYTVDSPVAMVITPYSNNSGNATNTNPGPIYYDRGTAGILLMAAANFDPNLVDNSLGPKTITGPNQVTSKGDKNVQTKNGGIPGQLP